MRWKFDPYKLAWTSSWNDWKPRRVWFRRQPFPVTCGLLTKDGLRILRRQPIVRKQRLFQLQNRPERLSLSTEFFSQKRLLFQVLIFFARNNFLYQLFTLLEPSYIPSRGSLTQWKLIWISLNIPSRKTSCCGVRLEMNLISLSFSTRREFFHRNILRKIAVIVNLSLVIRVK